MTILPIQLGTIHTVDNLDPKRVNLAQQNLDQTRHRRSLLKRPEHQRFTEDFVHHLVEPDERFHERHSTRMQTNVRPSNCQETPSDQAIYTLRDHQTTNVVVTREHVNELKVDHDLADVEVGTHPFVRLRDVVEGKARVDDWLEHTGFELRKHLGREASRQRDLFLQRAGA
jgi:hypothetical protein